MFCVSFGVDFVLLILSGHMILNDQIFLKSPHPKLEVMNQVVFLNGMTANRIITTYSNVNYE